MKKTILAPAVAVAVSGLAFAGTSPAFADTATPTPEATTQAADAAAAALIIDPETVPNEDFVNKDKGVNVIVTGLTEGQKVVAEVTPVGAEGVEGAKFDAEAEADGSAAIKVYGLESDSDYTGEYQVTVTSADDADLNLTGTFTVGQASESDDDDDATTPAAETTTPAQEETTEAAKPAFALTPEKVSAKDFVNKDKGVTVTVENLTPGQEVDLNVRAKNANVEMLSETTQADANGVFTYTVYGVNAENPSAYIDDYTVTVTGEGVNFEGQFSVVANTSDDANGGAGNDDDDTQSGSSLPRTGAELGGLVAGAVLLTVGAATVLVTRRKARN